jgi:glutathione reductase (NADPH)
VFSQPALGSVGMTEDAARAAYSNVHIYKTDFRPMRNILADNDDRMMMKLIVNGDDDKVLGCHIGGHEAGEFIQLVAIAITAGLTKAQFDATCAVHPTATEELVTMATRN